MSDTAHALRGKPVVIYLRDRSNTNSREAYEGKVLSADTLGVIVDVKLNDGKTKKTVIPWTAIAYVEVV